MTPFLSSVIYSVAADNLGKNWVFSPASYMEAMHSLIKCLDGDNLAEATAAMGITETSVADSKRALTGLDETYNCLLFAEEYRDALNATVIAALARLGSDFKAFTTPDSAIAEVNRLVEEKTRGRIRGLANRENVNELTKLIILNCVYFKRDWAHPLKTDTWTKLRFVNADGTTIELSPLTHQTYYRYYEDPLFDLVELPYKDSTVCCYLFVPTARGSVFEILNGFADNFGATQQVRRNLNVHLTVPPFKVEATLPLNGATSTAGVRSVFQWSKDWGIIDWSKLKPEAAMCVTQIVQKAFIDFNEKGTEATAATMMCFAISGCCMSFESPPPPKIITADRPFVFCLADTVHPDQPLFVGAVNHLS
jgi:serine protease inhibitor